MIKTATFAVASLALLPSLLAGRATARDDPDYKQAESIFAATGFQRGLIVHLGCGDGRLTAAFRRTEFCVIHGLDTDAARIAEARKYIRSLGIYGPVSVEHWDSPELPYVDNVVNLIVAETPGDVSSAEMMRVLVPGGMAYVKRGECWTKTVKPPREGVDEWTHYLYDASGNPVAHDVVVGPPRHLQWTAGPEHGRSHEFTPSIRSVVSARGRIFYIEDRSELASVRDVGQCMLVARDAYNGVVLWERLREGFFSRFGWTQGPRQLQRRLVAVGDRVYVTPGYHGSVVELDAATGMETDSFRDTVGADEILFHDGVLLVVVREVTEERRAEFKKLWPLHKSWEDSPLNRRETREPFVNNFRNVERRAPVKIVAIDLSAKDALREETGREAVWEKSGEETAGLKPLSLRACGDRVYCEMRGGVHCFELRTGKPVWVAPAVALRAVSETAVVCVNKQKITLLSPEDGKPRWSQPVTLANVRDALLIGDSIWLGGGKPYDSGRSKYTGPSWGAYFAVQHDLATGRVVKEITAENPKHHHRCYESKATQRYILGGRRGTEFLDLESGDYLWHSWARGTCRYGVMPCNGMLYVPPHACGCYITAKLKGFNALAPERRSQDEVRRTKEEERLEKGPAFGEVRVQRLELRGPEPDDRNLASGASASIPHSALRIPHSGDWPTYRGDAQRSGRARCVVPLKLKRKWSRSISWPATPPTVAGGKAFVALRDQHVLSAIDTASGEIAWTFMAGGRIDSPPTIHARHVIFGSRDGYVYAVRATDGTLAWRFRAARDPRRIVANQQFESASPVHGSVLVQDGALAFTAGRSSYLDGGLDLYRLNPVTGQTLSKTTIYSPDPETGRQPQQYGPNSMPGARSDILAADEEYLYLRDLTFTKEGTEVADRKPHLFTLTDFLDDTWTHRSYWIFGTKSSISTGCSGRDKKLLYGRLLVFDDTTVYGYGRETVHWSSEFEDGEYRIFARRSDSDKPLWSKPVPVHIKAMVLSGDVLFAAGGGAQPGRNPISQPPFHDRLLLAFSAADGTELARHSITAAPVLDGMAAAQGELVLTQENGTVVCMTKE